MLVAAHTSAGKTVVAEYAFAMALRDKSRVVYTSPLKALSNQKYRELYEQFQDVGLMTGDVTINPNASCLVMTTEILRSMLYKGAEVVRELSLVVYDEIHYLRDKERGFVWEESIILMPKTARFAFLSATIPNALEFAQWVAQVHGSACHVVYTDYRPTPLQHYIYPAGGDGLYLVVDEQANFREDNFQKAIASLTETAVDGKAGGKGGRGKGRGSGGGGSSGKEVVIGMQQDKDKSDIFKIVRLIMERNYDPVIVFSFSKKECEALMNQMVSLELTDEGEQKLIEGIYWNALDCLSEMDRRLPQVNQMLPMLKRGFGMHHSGLLPIIKEVVEILFQEGLIKALFATETFSTGLNMPAKTVVFTNTRKFDGGCFRWVSSGEYIQMSGRAGRRGLDDRGIVVLMLDTKMEPAIAKDMIRGAPDTLYSAFNLRYNMLLNLMRVEGASPEALLRHSYRQFQLQRALPVLQQRVTALQQQHDAVQVEDESEAGRYLALLEQLAQLQAELRAYINAATHCVPFLKPGRLLRMLPDTNNPAAASLPSFREHVDRAAGGATVNGSGNGQSTASTSEASMALELVQPGVWGAVADFHEVTTKDDAFDDDLDNGGSSRKKRRKNYVVEVLVNCDPATVPGTGPKSKPHFLPAGQSGGVPMVVAFPLEQIDRLSTVRVRLQQDLRPLDNRNTSMRAVAESVRRLQQQYGSVPLLDPEQDMKLRDKALRKLQSRIEEVEGMLAGHRLAAVPGLLQRLALLQEKQALSSQIKLAKKEVKTAQSLVLLDDLRAKQRVLRKLGYTDRDDMLQPKARLAQSIQSADELVLTELVLDGALNQLSPEQICGLCSCFVWTEKNGGNAQISEELQGPVMALRDVARRVGKLAVESKLAVDVEQYVAGFRTGLVEPVAAWARGANFSDVLKMAQPCYEGSLVRCLRRLEELLRQLAGGVKNLGNHDLAAVCEEGIAKIKRDIVFAASLYL